MIARMPGAESAGLLLRFEIADARHGQQRKNVRQVVLAYDDRVAIVT